MSCIQTLLQILLDPVQSCSQGLVTGWIGADQPVGGIATSGWRGRSQSLGIADAVTVLADTAARADAAATARR